MPEMVDDEVLKSIDDYLRDYCRDKIANLIQSDSHTLEIDFQQLRQARPHLADDYLDDPDSVQHWFEEAFKLHDFPVDEDFSAYTVRFVNISKTSEEVVYDVGEYDPGEVAFDFASVRGQVSQITEPSVRFETAVFECQRCGTESRIPQPSDSEDLVEPHECQGCERQGPFRFQVERSKQYGVNVQRARMQVMPEKAKSVGDATIDVHIEDDLTDQIRPGDRVAVNSTIKLEQQGQDANDFKPVAKARSFDTLDQDFSDIDPEEYMDRIEEIAADHPIQKITESILPRHYGDDTIKQALTLQLASGDDYQMPDGGTIRGNIHVFLVGDPGVGKSDLLTRIREIAPRSVYTTGANSTKAGLTVAAVQNDFGDGGWTYQAGALVEAHEGVCCIDELDDMDEEDRAGLLESMSKQEINPSSAAGSNFTFPANTTVLAAANPSHGRFDQYEPLGDQIDVESTLISRFDLIFTLTDAVDEEHDLNIAETINTAVKLGQKERRNESTDGFDEVRAPIDDDVLRAYIAYARQQDPILTEEADRRIKQEYIQIRTSNDDDGPIPTTPRTVEALNRLAAASAKLRLSETVEKKDTDLAVDILRASLNDVGIDPESGDFDTDMIETGLSKAQRDRIKSLKSIITSLEEEYDPAGVPIDDVYEYAADQGIDQSKVDHELDKLKQQGELYEPAENELRTT